MGIIADGSLHVKPKFVLEELASVLVFSLTVFHKGQMNEKTLFYAKTPGYTLWITQQGLVFDSSRESFKNDSNSRWFPDSDGDTGYLFVSCLVALRFTHDTHGNSRIKNHKIAFSRTLCGLILPGQLANPLLYYHCSNQDCSSSY